MGTISKLSNRSRFLIIVGVFLAIVALGSVLYIIFSNTPSNEDTADESKVTTYTDPYSGETLTETENKAPESFGNENPIVFFGFSKLLDSGVTSQQLEITKTALRTYSADRQINNIPAIKEVTINFETLSQIPPSMSSDSNGKITYDIILNRDESLTFTLETTIRSIADASIVIKNKKDNSTVFTYSPGTSRN